MEYFYFLLTKTHKSVNSLLSSIDWAVIETYRARIRRNFSAHVCISVVVCYKQRVYRPAQLTPGAKRNTTVLVEEIQQDAAVCRYLLLLNYSTYFGRPSRPSSGIHKTVVAASGTDHTIWGASFFKRDHLGHVWRSLLVWSVPEAATTVLCTLDDGRDGRPKHVE